jgi:hypothetical protein
MRHTSVVGAARQTVSRQALGDLLGGFLLGDVDDARLAAPRRQPLLQAL